VVTRRLQVERRKGSVRRPKTGVPPTVLRNCATVVSECTVCYRVLTYYILRDYFLHFVAEVGVLAPKHPTSYGLVRNETIQH